MTLLVRNATACALIASAVLLGACSKDDETNQWVTESIYSGEDSVSKPRVAQGSNGDLIVIWQEFENGNIQADTAKNTLHDEQKIHPVLIANNSEHGDHDHYFQCQRTNVWSRRYDASAGSWGSATKLQTGKWRKTTTYLLQGGETSYELDEYVANPLNSLASIALDGSGNALALWIQDQVDDCNAIPTSSFQPVLYSASYDASTNTWSTPATVQNNSSDVTGVKAIHVNLNSSGAGLVAWEQNQDDSLGVGGQNLPTIYATAYGSGTLGTPSLINDSTSSGGYTLYATATQPALAVNSSGDGVIVWRHMPRKTNATDEPLSEIRAKRYSATGNSWNNSLTLGSSTARTGNYTASSTVETPAVAMDDNGQIWAAWIDAQKQDNANGSVTNRLAKVMANSISVTDVVGTASALQTDDTNTTVNETLYSQSDVSIAINGSGVVLATWIMREVYDNTDGLINVWNNNITNRLQTAFHSAGAWGNAVTAFDSRLDVFAPQVKHLGANNFVLAWTQTNDPRDEAHYAVNVVTFLHDSATDRFATRGETVGSTKDPYSMTLNSNGQGNASLVWYSDGNVAFASLQ